MHLTHSAHAHIARVLAHMHASIHLASVIAHMHAFIHLAEVIAHMHAFMLYIRFGLEAEAASNILFIRFSFFCNFWVNAYMS